MKTSKKKHRYPTGRSSVNHTVEADTLLLASTASAFTVKDYLWMNVAFDVFLLVQIIVVRLLLPDMIGLYFFFFFLVVGFFVVSVLDYFAARADIGLVQEEPVPSV